MGLDIRIPIGSLFALLGALLGGYGIFSSPAIYRKSLGINVNLWWGAVLLAFGLAMLALAYKPQPHASRWNEGPGPRPRNCRCCC